jgi:protein TonB
MFQTLAATAARAHPGRLHWTLLVAAGLHAAILTALVTFPLLFPDRVPARLGQFLIFLPEAELIAPPPAPPVSEPAGDPAPGRPGTLPPGFVDGDMVVPPEIPDAIPPDVNIGELIRQLSGPAGPRIPGGIPGDGVVPGYGVPGLSPTVEGYRPPTPPPRPPEREPAVRRVILPPRVLAARLLRAAPPEYPVLARASRLEGDVMLKVRVDETGRVTEATVTSGNPILAAAAEAAVRGWLYQPTLVNGAPVPVEGTIVVKFRLGSR